MCMLNPVYFFSRNFARRETVEKILAVKSILLKTSFYKHDVN